MIDIGITSFKIEGRMRSLYYVATVVGTYRKAIDEYYHNKENYVYNKEYERILNNCANRESTVQFFDGNYDEKCQYYNGRMEASNQEFLGIVLAYDEEKKEMIVEERNYFKKGDKVEIFGPDGNIIPYEINEIYDEENNKIEVVRHPKQIVKIKIDKKIKPNYLIRKIAWQIKKTVVISYLF